MSDVLFINTHLALTALEKYEIDEAGLTIYGRTFWEHSAEKPLVARENNHFSSYRNDFSFWLTEHSLVNILRAAGYSLTARLYNPLHPNPFRDRSCWIAVRDEDVTGDVIWPDPDYRSTECPLLAPCQGWPPNPQTRKL